MAKFRDYLERDLKTFINTNEFAEEIDIDGNKVTVIIDSDALKELQLSNNGEGLATNELLFHVPKNELPFEPFFGQDLYIKNELYYVNDVKEDDGLYTIRLGVAKS